MSNVIWEFKTASFIVRMSWEWDNDPDLSWADAETMEKIDDGEWGCYQFVAEVIDRATGAAIGEDYLGGSIYANPEEFRDHVGLAIKSREDGRNYGSYFTGMVKEAIAGARKVYEKPRPKLRSTAPEIDDKSREVIAALIVQAATTSAWGDACNGFDAAMTKAVHDACDLIGEPYPGSKYL